MGVKERVKAEHRAAAEGSLAVVDAVAEAAALGEAERVGPGVLVREVPAVDLTEGRGGSVYVVQAAGVGAEFADWSDVARVTAAKRTQRRTIITAAVEVAGLELPATVRLLDEEAAREHPVSAEMQPPKLVIG